MIGGMRTIRIEIPEATYRGFVAQAAQTKRNPLELMREVLQRHSEGETESTPVFEKSKRSVLDHPPLNLGQIIKPWSSRAEMLEDYFDRD